MRKRACPRAHAALSFSVLLAHTHTGIDAFLLAPASGVVLRSSRYSAVAACEESVSSSCLATGRQRRRIRNYTRRGTSGADIEGKAQDLQHDEQQQRPAATRHSSAAASLLGFVATAVAVPALTWAAVASGPSLPSLMAEAPSTVLIASKDSAAIWAEKTSSATAAAAAAAAAASSASLDKVEGQEVVAVDKLEGQINATFKKATLQGSVGNFEEALKLYNTVVRSSPGYVYAYSNRGNILIATGDLEGAIRDYTKALSLAQTEGLRVPDQWLMHLNRGSTYLALDRTAEATTDFEMAAKLNKRGNPMLFTQLGLVNERAGDYELACINYNKAVVRDPGNVQPWWLRFSLALYQDGKPFDSLEYLKRVHTKFYETDEVNAALTAVNWGRGSAKEAQESWKTVSVANRKQYLDRSYLENQLRWPPKVVDSLLDFSKQASGGALIP